MAINEPPAALDMETDVTDLHQFPVAIPYLTLWAELEYLHVGDAPTVTDWLLNQRS